MIANWELTDQKNFKELLEEVVFVGRLKLFLDKSRRECFCFVLFLFCQKRMFLFCLSVWASISPFPFYWSARDLAADMFSMETDKNQKNKVGRKQHK